MSFYEYFIICIECFVYGLLLCFGLLIFRWILYLAVTWIVMVVFFLFLFQVSVGMSLIEKRPRCVEVMQIDKLKSLHVIFSVCLSICLPLLISLFMCVFY